MLIIGITVPIVVLVVALLTRRAAPRLSVERSPVQGVRDRLLYTATLRSRSLFPVAIEGVKMPGGYVGSGSFFPCKTELWDPERQKWKVVFSGTLAELGNPSRIFHSYIYRWHSVEVCRAELPLDRIPPGGCARFVVRPRWDPNAVPEIASPPFLIESGADKKSSVTSCTP